MGRPVFIAGVRKLYGQKKEVEIRALHLEETISIDNKSRYPPEAKRGKGLPGFCE